MHTSLAVTAIAAVSAALTPLAVNTTTRSAAATATATPPVVRVARNEAPPCLKPIRVVYKGYGEPVVCRDR